MTWSKEKYLDIKEDLEIMLDVVEKLLDAGVDK